MILKSIGIIRFHHLGEIHQMNEVSSDTIKELIINSKHWNLLQKEYVFPFISTSFWGISIVGAKIVGDYGFSPIEITFGRFALASVIFIPLLIYYHCMGKAILPKTGKEWAYLVGLSMTGVAVNNTIFYYGLERTNASIASMIVSLNPLMTMIFAVILLGERFTKRKGISVLLGIIGVSLIIGFEGSSGRIQGNLLVLLGITIWGSSFSFSRKCTDAGLSSVAVTGLSEIIGTLFLLPVIIQDNSLPKYQHLNWETLFWFFFMGILSSVIAYVLHYQAIAVFGASRVAPSTNIIPFSGAITSLILLGEHLEGSPILGLIFVLAGVYIVQSEKIT